MTELAVVATISVVLFLFVHWTSRYQKYKTKKIWKKNPENIVTVKWPADYIELKPDDPEWAFFNKTGEQYVFSSDPNDHYRPWLEKNIGKQGRDWDWRIKWGTDTRSDSLEIVVSKSKKEYVMMISLMWN